MFQKTEIFKNSDYGRKEKACFQGEDFRASRGAQKTGRRNQKL